MKPILKRMLRSSPVQSFVSLLIAAYIRFVYYTSRKHMDVHPLAVPYMEGLSPAVFAFWHGQLLMIAPACPKVRMHVMISWHRDGELISRSINRFGIEVIRGSSKHGGRSVATQAIKILKSGGSIVMTPDGPRGPRMHVHEGTITLAKLADVPIIPVACASSKHKLLSNWDKFMVVYPFGALYYHVGAPLKATSKEELETFMVAQTTALDFAAAGQKR